MYVYVRIYMYVICTYILYNQMAFICNFECDVHQRLMMKLILTSNEVNIDLG